MARVPDVSRRAPRQCLLWALLLCAAGRPQANQEARGGSTTNWPILVVGKIVGNCPLSSGQALQRNAERASQSPLGMHPGYSLALATLPALRRSPKVRKASA